MLKNEDGSVMILALILLVLLTLMGISATSTSTIEVQIAGNERDYKQNFYETEAAVMTGAQLLENTSDASLNDTSTLNWVNTNPINLNNLDMTSSIWNTIGGAGMANGKFTVVENVGSGSSRGLSLADTTRLHDYKAYGVYDQGGNAQTIIEIGYKRRF